MKKLQFSFSTKLTFDDYVHDHSFALRFTPVESPAQHITAFGAEISPFASTRNTVDAFGNTVTSGFLQKEHRFLDFEINGIAEIDISKPKTDFMPCYRYQTHFTKPDVALSEFHRFSAEKCSCSDPYGKAMFYSEKISEQIRYEKGVTTIKTTAAEAFGLKAGVCQDYAHILLSMLRMDGIPCRYAAGLACCDGETHGWVEVWDGEKWVGIDPANDRPANEDYLILSQGRDFGDCAIDRGVMFGAYTKQLQLISSKLEEIA